MICQKPYVQTDVIVLCALEVNFVGVDSSCRKRTSCTSGEPVSPSDCAQPRNDCCFSFCIQRHKSLPIRVCLYRSSQFWSSATAEIIGSLWVGAQQSERMKRKSEPLKIKGSLILLICLFQANNFNYQGSACRFYLLRKQPNASVQLGSSSAIWALTNSFFNTFHMRERLGSRAPALNAYSCWQDQPVPIQVNFR